MPGSLLSDRGEHGWHHLGDRLTGAGAHAGGRGRALAGGNVQGGGVGVVDAPGDRLGDRGRARVLDLQAALTAAPARMEASPITPLPISSGTAA